MVAITPKAYNPLKDIAPKAPVKLKSKLSFSSVAPSPTTFDPLAQAKIGTKATNTYNLAPSGISIQSPKAIAWQLQKTKDVETQKIVKQDNIIGELWATVLENPNADPEKLKAAFPELSHLDKDVIWELWATILENPNVTPEQLRKAFPELDSKYKAPSKVWKNLDKATNILKWANEFLASGIESFVEWWWWAIERWLNKASDYLLWTNAVEEARIRDERLKWKWVITTPFWIDTTTPAAQMWKTVWKVVWVNSLIPTPTLWWSTFLARAGKNAIVWWLWTQASTLLSEWRIATPTETAIWAGTQWLFWAIANVKSKKWLEWLVQPKMTPSVEAERAAKWLKTVWLFGKVWMKSTKQEEAMAKLANKIWLNPSKTVTSNVNKTLASLNKETDNLINIVENNPTIFNPKEITSRMKKIEKPLMIRWWENEAKYDAIIAKFEEILKWEKKNSAWLLRARKKLDAWINAEIPNLYNSDAMTPLKVAVTKIRKIPNEWINEKIWWDIVKESLWKQSLMLDMVDNMAWKTEKSGTSALSRFVKRNKGTVWAVWALWWAAILNKLWVKIPWLSWWWWWEYISE